MPAAVLQLYTDLNAIPAGTAATDAQHQTIVADLDALATGVFTPDPADVDQLATDLGTAATNGLFSDNVLEYLADDFIGDPDDPTTDPDGWMDDIQDDVSSLIDPPPTLLDPGDPTTFDPGNPVDTTVYELGVTAVAPVGESSTRVSLQLTEQGIPPFLLENYSGQMHLSTRTAAGGTAASTLRLRTIGLPPNNPYTVSITRLSDGASVTLGKLHVRNGFTWLPVAFDAASPAGPQAEILTYGNAVFGGANAKKPLPAGFDAADVATVTVTDAQGVVRLTGNLADGTPTSRVQALNLRLSGAASVAASLPSATVTARHRITPDGVGVRFHLSAHHLPGNAPVTLLADGESVGQFTTTSKGRLVVTEGPVHRETNGLGGSRVVNALPNDVDLSGARSFSITDAQGNVLLSGSLD